MTDDTLARLEEAEARVAELSAALDRRTRTQNATAEVNDTLVARIIELERVVDRVRALAGEWDGMDSGLISHMVHWDYRTELRDALGEQP